MMKLAMRKTVHIDYEPSISKLTEDGHFAFQSVEYRASILMDKLVLKEN